MAIGFKGLAEPNDVTEYRVMTIASQAYTIGDAVAYSRSAHTVIPATASTTVNDLFGVAMETVTSAATQLLVAILTPSGRWVADTTNTPSANDNYQRMILTDKATVNNTHTDDTTSAAVFTQLGVVDSTNKRIVGTFNKVAGVSA